MLEIVLRPQSPYMGIHPPKNPIRPDLWVFPKRKANRPELLDYLTQHIMAKHCPLADPLFSAIFLRGIDMAETIRETWLKGGAVMSQRIPGGLVVSMDHGKVVGTSKVVGTNEVVDTDRVLRCTWVKVVAAQEDGQWNIVTAYPFHKNKEKKAR